MATRSLQLCLSLAVPRPPVESRVEEGAIPADIGSPKIACVDKKGRRSVQQLVRSSVART